MLTELLFCVLFWFPLRFVFKAITGDDLDTEPIEPTEEQIEAYEAERAKDPLAR